MEFPKSRARGVRAPLANVQANISPELADAVRAACQAHGVTFKSAVEYGLRTFLEHAARVKPEKRRA